MTEQNQPGEQDWLTTKQVMEQYNLRKKRVYGWSYKKQVMTKHVDHDLYFNRASVEAFLQKQNGASKAIPGGEDSPDVKAPALKKLAVRKIQPNINHEIASLTELVRKSALRLDRLEEALAASDLQKAILLDRIYRLENPEPVPASKPKKKGKSKKVK
ncbi:MAG: hypothetical protein JWP00_1269 [Chloroflexi bacterium]|jgi:hypothetical protein|nr:hypothetical protein [Chloroflexota bacterium]